LDKSPIIFRTGNGCFRTTLGKATIWSSRAICGQIVGVLFFHRKDLFQHSPCGRIGLRAIALIIL
jgi:hypothetical protein